MIRSLRKTARKKSWIEVVVVVIANRVSQKQHFAIDDVVLSLCNLTAGLGDWSGPASPHQRHGEGKNDEVSWKRVALTFTYMQLVSTRFKL